MLLRDHSFAAQLRPRWPLPCLAFRLRVVIPYEKLVDVTMEPQARDFHQLTFRLAGVSVPGSLTAGTFHGANEDAFCLCGAGDNALAFETRDLRYQLVVVEVPDPGAGARDVRAEPRARRQ